MPASAEPAIASRRWQAIAGQAGRPQEEGTTPAGPPGRDPPAGTKPIYMILEDGSSNLLLQRSVQSRNLRSRFRKLPRPLRVHTVFPRRQLDDWHQLVLLGLRLLILPALAAILLFLFLVLPNCRHHLYNC